MLERVRGWVAGLAALAAAQVGAWWDRPAVPGRFVFSRPAFGAQASRGDGVRRWSRTMAANRCGLSFSLDSMMRAPMLPDGFFWKRDKGTDLWRIYRGRA